MFRSMSRLMDSAVWSFPGGLVAGRVPMFPFQVSDDGCSLLKFSCTGFEYTFAVSYLGISYTLPRGEGLESNFLGSEVISEGVVTYPMTRDRGFLSPEFQHVQSRLFLSMRL